MKTDIRLGDIVIDRKSYGNREAIVVAEITAIEKGEPKEYLIAYMDAKETGTYPYQRVYEEETERIREPLPEEIKLYREYRDDLIRREIEKYEEEYKNAHNSEKILLSNLRYYGLI